MRRLILGSMVGIILTATPALAAEGDNAATALTPAMSVAASSLAQRPEMAAGLNLGAGVPVVRRPSLLPALYLASAGLQAFDAYSTLNVLKAGGREQNPVMKAAVKSPAAFVAIKAGVTAASILAAERLWKNNNRVGAVLTMVLSNGMMACVAAHNASVLSRVR